MTGSVREIAEIPEAVGRLVSGNPRATLFLEPEWLVALRKGYPELRPRCLVLEEGGEIAGALPFTVVHRLGLEEVASLPFGTHGGPLLAPGASEGGARTLVEAFAARVRRRKVFRFEMAVFDPVPAVGRILREVLGGAIVPATTFVLDLAAGETAIWEGYEQQLRRSVRRGERGGIEVREGGSEALEVFHRLYARQSRTFSIPWAHSLRALTAIAGALGPRVRIWIASRRGIDVCGQLVLERPGREIHLWLSGAVPESRHPPAFHFLLHELILNASRRGFEACHFGTSLGNPGVEAFKRSFHPEERPLVRYHDQAGWAARIQGLRRLPAALNPRRRG
jgi:Acetyltransferase (GNAT) domain